MTLTTVLTLTVLILGVGLLPTILVAAWRYLSSQRQSHRLAKLEDELLKKHFRVFQTSKKINDLPGPKMKNDSLV